MGKLSLFIVGEPGKDRGQDSHVGVVAEAVSNLDCKSSVLRRDLTDPTHRSRFAVEIPAGELRPVGLIAATCSSIESGKLTTRSFFRRRCGAGPPLPPGLQATLPP